MVQAVEASLKRLGTDYIDLYWLHIWDQLTPVEEVMRGFDDLVRAGKVLYVGISDAPAWVVAKSNTLAELRGWTRYVGLQIEYSLLERTVERELVPMARDQQMTVLAWSPLRNGLLTGKYLPENAKQSAAEGARMHSEMMKGFGSVEEATHATVREVVAVGEELGVSAAQVALAWLRCRPVPVIPIIGARKLSQLEDNIRSLEVTLSAGAASTSGPSQRRFHGLPARLHGTGAGPRHCLRGPAGPDQSLSHATSTTDVERESGLIPPRRRRGAGNVQLQALQGE